MALPGTSQGRVDILSQVREQVVAMHLILSGEFDAAINQYNALKADVESKLTFVQTAEDVTRVKAEADAYSAETRASADAIMKAATTMKDQVDAAGKAAINAQTALAAAQDQLEVDKKEFDQHVQVMTEELDKEHADLKTAQEELADEQRTLSQLRDRLEKDQATLTARLEALKVL